MCYPCRLRESMQRLTLVRAQMSAVLLLFSDCFLRGALSLILSTTLAGWVGARRFHNPQTDDILVYAYTLYMFRPLVPPSLDSELGKHSGHAWSYAGHRSQVPFTAFSTFTCVFLTFTFTTCAFFCIFTCWARISRLACFVFFLAQREHLHVPWGHLVWLHRWIQLLSFLCWWVPSDSHKVWDLTTSFWDTNMTYNIALSYNSYDYDAPVSEAGDLTEKWWAIREVVGRWSF